MNTPDADLRLADRLALRDLVEAYAHGVDRRRLEEVGLLFLADGVLASHNGDPAEVPAFATRNGRDEIVRVMEMVRRYDVTSHVLGQQMLQFDTTDPDRAIGITYCMAHHVWAPDGIRVNKVMSIRYHDRYLRTAQGWRFAERRLAVDWTEERPMGTEH